MVNEFQLSIAEGFQMTVLDGWEFEASGEERVASEIVFKKNEVHACLRMIALGDELPSLGLDRFRLTLLEALVNLGCLIEPAQSQIENVIVAAHPEKKGQYIHLLKEFDPLVHISAGGLISGVHIDELTMMLKSIHITNHYQTKSSDSEFGELIPFELDERHWLLA